MRFSPNRQIKIGDNEWQQDSESFAKVDMGPFRSEMITKQKTKHSTPALFPDQRLHLFRIARRLRWRWMTKKYDDTKCANSKLCDTEIFSDEKNKHR